MNKQEILNKYNNEEDRLLISKLLDKVEFVEKRNTVEYTDFLDIRQRGLLEKVLKEIKYTNYAIYGGYDLAERTVIIIYPEKLENVFEQNLFDYNQILKVIRIKLPNETKGKYSHRDYLGAVIKIGFKREKVGDILVSLDGADMIVESQSVKILMNGLKELTRFSKSEFEEININDIEVPMQSTEILNIIIPSMRVDSIVSELIKTSRSKVIEIINAERVIVNCEVAYKNSKLLKENDVVTVRGKGKFKINKIVNYTKKGNIVLEVEKYI